MDCWSEAEHLDVESERQLSALLSDDASVEEALAQNADLVRVALIELKAHPERAREISRRINTMVVSYLEPTAARAAYQSLIAPL